MKIAKIFSYKRMTRAAYLLGIVFLLAGMMLSMINQPVAASNPALQATQPAVKPQPPRGPVPPVSPQPKAPSLPPSDPAPAPVINNSGVRINNQAPALAPNLARPRIQAIVDGYGIEFTQANYCLDKPEAGEVTATVRVVLPEGVTASLRTNWRVVQPNNLGDLNEIHWNDPINVTNGDRVDIVAWWPGNTGPGVSPGTEIHYGATLTNPTYGIQEAGLDIYYVDGGCNARPPLHLTAVCAENGVEWTVYNIAGAAYPATFTYSLDGGPQMPGGTVPGGTVANPGSLMFLTTNRQSHTVTITWEDLVGGSASVTVTSEPCGETVPALTLSHVCAANGGVDFRVSNPGEAAVTFEYTVNGGAASSATVAAGATNDVFVNLPAGVAYTVVVTWPDGQDGVGTATETSAAEECAPVDLVVAKQCVELGLIRWTVNNPSDETVSYTWNLDNGLLTGGGSLLPGETETITETSGGAHTLVVTWDEGEETLSSTADECRQPTPPDLTLAKLCVEGGNIEWRVTNSGETNTTFTWTLDSGAETGSGSVNAGATVLVTTTAGGAHLLTVTWTEGSVSLNSEPEECGITNPPLTISKVCYEDGGIQWTVTNNSDTALPFTWNLDGGVHTGSDTIAAGDSLDVVVSSGGAHTFSIAWANGSATLASDAEECGGERVPDLSLVAICAEAEGTLIWRVTNPGIEPVTFTWSLDGGAEASLTVNGNASLDVTTSTTTAAHEMVITWPDGLGGEGTRTTTSQAGACQEVTPTPTPELSLVLRCVDDRIQWTARNSGSEAVDFEWQFDSGSQSGSDSVAAGGSTAFLVSSNGRHTVTLSWPLENPTRSVSRTSSRDACVPDVETPPVTPTPGIIFTPTPGILITTTPGVFVTATPSDPGIPVTGATPLATVGAPGSTGSGGQVLIPTTGGDLSASGLLGLGMLQTLFTNLGLLFLGFALVLHGVGRMR